MKNRFYMMCTRDTVGSNASFHCKGGRGYSSDISKAHEYTLEEVQKAWELGRSIDQPICADSVDELAVYHVDHQCIPSDTVIIQGNIGYVGYVKGDWDGNDVYWLTGVGFTSADFNLAKKFSNADLGRKHVIWLPFGVADAKKRKTFPIVKFNARKMVQAAGVITPERIKKQRRRKANSGKTRWNCPCCGKISWQHNPYDYDGCLDPVCGEYRNNNYLYALEC